jgi:hypothetical protein
MKDIGKEDIPMTIVTFENPSITRRHPDMICWRVAAIYRCCLRVGMSKEWALEKLREIAPDGKRDHMADIWFAGMNYARHHYMINEVGIKIPEDMDDSMDMAA